MGSNKYLKFFQRVKSQQNLINDIEIPNTPEHEPMFHGALNWVSRRVKKKNGIAFF